MKQNKSTNVDLKTETPADEKPVLVAAVFTINLLGGGIKPTKTICLKN
jgi:hypothetical protein